MKQIANVKLPQGGVYAIAFRPDGKVLAAAGADGMVRLYQPRDRLADQGVRPGDGQADVGGPERRGHRRSPPKQEEAIETEALPKGMSLASL